MRNPVTGKHEVRRVFKQYNFEVVGVGETKEEAKADLQKKLEAYKHPLAGIPGYNGPKYRPLFKPVGTVRSPGYETIQQEDGSVRYVLNENRQAQVFAVDRGEQNLADDAKVETEAE